MKICIYKGSEELVRRSGVGIAIRHQEKILREAGCEIVDRIDDDTDAVHINTVFPGSAVEAVIARLRGKTVIYYGHSTMEDFRHSFKGSNFLAPVFRGWIKFCYRLGDVILTPTAYSRSLLLRYGIKKPIVVLSNGIDLKQFKPDGEKRKLFRQTYHLKDDEKVILSVGHYIERKGILEFLEMARKMPEVKFIWFGYTSPKLIPARIQKAIDEAPDNVIFPGYVEPKELTQAYQGCDLFCFMSHEETEGIVVLEALASKIPVLVRDIPVYEGWLRNGANVYKASDTDEFAVLAGKILDGQVPDLTEQGWKTARERSFPEIAVRLKGIYRTYCHKKGTSPWKWRTLRENADH